MATISNSLQLITLFVFGLLLSNSIATVTLGTCKSQYCAGETVSFTCSADNENIQVVLGDTNGGDPILNEWFNDTSVIGEVGSNKGVSFNKTTSTSIRVWFTADMSFDGFLFECSDVENETDIETMECKININSNVPMITSFGIEDPIYCSVANYTWQVTGDDTCLQSFGIRITPEGNTSMTTSAAKSDRWYALYEDDIKNLKHSINIAPKTIEGQTPFTSMNMRSVTFDVPMRPSGIRVVPGEFMDNKDHVNITINWMGQDTSRPNVMWYYVWANITETDENKDDGSGVSSGDDGDDGDDDNDDMMNDFLLYVLDGDVTMMKFSGVDIGRQYIVRILADNCFGNSTWANYPFIVERPTPMPTTSSSTMDMSATMSPSPTLEEESEGLATYIIVIISVVGAVVLVALIVFLVIAMVCCCICCSSGSSKKHNDIEMSGKGGTRL